MFKTLVETSQTIDKKNKDPEVDSDEKDKDKDKTESESKEPTISYDAQLQLLLENLNKNEKLNPGSKEPAPGALKMTKAMSSEASSHQEKPRPTQVYHANNQNANQLMTQAYHLINEVIMHPQIMWTRNFFYSLGAMVQAQQ